MKNPASRTFARETLVIHVDEPAETVKVSASKWAYTTFAVLFVMHLLDYMDRNILSAIVPQLRIRRPVSGSRTRRSGC